MSISPNQALHSPPLHHRAAAKLFAGANGQKDLCMPEVVSFKRSDPSEGYGNTRAHKHATKSKTEIASRFCPLPSPGKINIGLFRCGTLLGRGFAQDVTIHRVESIHLTCIQNKYNMPCGKLNHTRYRIDKIACRPPCTCTPRLGQVALCQLVCMAMECLLCLYVCRESAGDSWSGWRAQRLNPDQGWERKLNHWSGLSSRRRLVHACV